MDIRLWNEFCRERKKEKQTNKPIRLRKDDRLIPNAGYIWMPDDCGCCT